MTVKELIEKLSEYDEETPVMIDAGDINCIEIDHIGYVDDYVIIS